MRMIIELFRFLAYKNHYTKFEIKRAILSRKIQFVEITNNKMQSILKSTRFETL